MPKTLQELGTLFSYYPDENDQNLAEHLLIAEEIQRYVKQHVKYSASASELKGDDLAILRHAIFKMRLTPLDIKTSIQLLWTVPDIFGERMYYNILKDVIKVKASKKLIGNCGEFSSFGADAFLKSKYQTTFAQCSIPDWDHTFFVIGYHASSITSEYPLGRHAVIADTWSGKIYPADQSSMKQYLRGYIRLAQENSTSPWNPSMPIQVDYLIGNDTSSRKLTTIGCALRKMRELMTACNQLSYTYQAISFDSILSNFTNILIAWITSKNEMILSFSSIETLGIYLSKIIYDLIDQLLILAEQNDLVQPFQSVLINAWMNGHALDNIEPDAKLMAAAYRSILIHYDTAVATRLILKLKSETPAMLERVASGPISMGCDLLAVSLVVRDEKYFLLLLSALRDETINKSAVNLIEPTTARSFGTSGRTLFYALAEKGWANAFTYMLGKLTLSTLNIVVNQIPINNLNFLEVVAKNFEETTLQLVLNVVSVSPELQTKLTQILQHRIKTAEAKHAVIPALSKANSGLFHQHNDNLVLSVSRKPRPSVRSSINDESLSCNSKFFLGSINADHERNVILVEKRKIQAAVK